MDAETREHLIGFQQALRALTMSLTNCAGIDRAVLTQHLRAFAEIKDPVLVNPTARTVLHDLANGVDPSVPG